MRYLLIASFYCLFSFALYSQEQLQHEKKTYMSEDNKLFINKDLPIYLWLSTSKSENSQKHLLQSESCKDYTNPLYLDTDGINTVRTPSKVDTVTKKAVLPREDIIFEIYADGVTPVSKFKTENGDFKMIKGKRYASGDIKGILSAKDRLSGVAKTYYSINGAAFQEYYQPLDFTEEKEYTVKYYSVDNVGNAESIKTIVFTLDKMAPTGALQIKGKSEGNVVAGNARISIAFEDFGSGVGKVVYSIDNGKETAYSQDIHVGWMKEGKHTITYKSTDNVGNESASITYDFFIDKTAPKIIDELIGDIYYLNGKEFVSGRTQLKLTAIDNKAGVEEVYYSFNGDEYNLYTKPVDVPTGNKSLNITFYALDKVGNNNKNRNQSGTSTRMSYTDLTGPRLDYSLGGKVYKARDTVFINSSTKIKLRAYDNETQVKTLEYSLDKSSKQLYESPITVEKEGNVKLEYWGTDMLNNLNKAEYHFTVDNSGPEIFERFSSPAMSQKENKNIYPSSITLFVSATDKGAGFSKMQYSINNSKLLSFNGMISGLLKNTTYSITVKSFDKLGNMSEKTIEFITGE